MKHPALIELRRAQCCLSCKRRWWRQFSTLLWTESRHSFCKPVRLLQAGQVGSSALVVDRPCFPRRFIFLFFLTFFGWELTKLNCPLVSFVKCAFVDPQGNEGARAARRGIGGRSCCGRGVLPKPVAFSYWPRCDRGTPDTPASYSSCSTPRENCRERDAR